MSLVVVGGDGGGDGFKIVKVGNDDEGGLCGRHLQWLLDARLWQC